MKYVYYGQELYHHGILGQKWGKHNGPPYPLGAKDHSQSEKTAGWKKSLGGGRNEDLYYRNDKKEKQKARKVKGGSPISEKKKGLTDKQKKYIKIGMAAAATVLATYGAYKLYENHDLIRMEMKMGKKNVDFIRNSGKFDYLNTKCGSLAGISDEIVNNISNQFGVKVKEITTSIMDDVNTLRNNRIPGDANDCGPLALDFFFRRAGFDITTSELGLGHEGGFSLNELSFYIKGLRKENIKLPGMNNEDCLNAIKSEILKQCGNDISKECVGLISLLPGNSGTGHFTSWYTENGKIKFVDIQKGYDISQRLNYQALENIIVSRLDDCEIKGRNLFGSKTDSTIKAIIKNFIK